MSGELVGKAPQEPSAGVRTPEIKIVGVETTEYRSGIPLQGFDSVVSALNTFASGRTRAGRATQSDLMDNTERQAGLMGVGLVLLATADVSGDRFVARMMEEARPAVEERGRWHGSYDYDAMGTSFFKSSVDIAKLPDVEDGYLLGLNAAYVGKQVEDGLAETLGVEQGLVRKTVTAVLESKEASFAIDFDQVANRLQGVYAEINSTDENAELTGGKILDAILETDQYGDSGKPFVLGVKDGLRVSLGLGTVGDRFRWSLGHKSPDQWFRDGQILVVPLAESYREEGGMEPASLVVDIRRHSEDKYNASPAIDPAMKDRMNEIASIVAAAFSQ